MECSMDHIVLNVEDEERMVAFYAEVLLLPAERLEAYRAGRVPFPSVRLSPDTIIDLFPPGMWRPEGASPRPPGQGNLNHFCIVVTKPDWEALLKRLRAKGVLIEEGPVARWGAHGTGTSLYFRDPEANLIEARYYEAGDNAEKCLLGS